MKAASGFAHEAVVSTGTLHNAQALAGGIDLAQGDSNRFSIL
tara:strand:+ start:989 stop:1114 length:126 start_codon:yes stop_codon:yes gene_type:complete